MYLIHRKIKFLSLKYSKTKTVLNVDEQFKICFRKIKTNIRKNINKMTQTKKIS